MTDAFTVESKDQEKLIRFFETKGPKQFKKAVALTLNEMAFLGRKTAIDEISDTMTVRALSFVSGGMIFRKAAMRMPVAKMFSTFGSRPRSRFSGWIEQETGQKSKRKKIATRAARGNNINKKIKPSYRMKNKGNFLRTSDLSLGHLGSQHKQINAMLARSNREGFSGAMIIEGHASINSGVYRLIGSRGNMRLTGLQYFNVSNTTPRRNQWMTHTVQRMKRSNVFNRSWIRSARRVVKL